MESLDKQYKPKLDKQIEAGSTFIKIALEVMLNVLILTLIAVSQYYLDSH